MSTEIYKIAKNASSYEDFANKLQQFQQNSLGYFLNELYPQTISCSNNTVISIRTTAAAQLADEGEHLRAEWLVDFGANPYHVAAIYALKAEHQLVEIYHRRYSLPPALMIENFAMAGNDETVAECLLFNLDEDEFKLKTEAAAHGYARVGNWAKVGEYGANINAVAHGYAIGGHHAEVKDCFGRGASINDIAHGYAFVGDHVQVETYRQLGADVKVIAIGYAMGGYDVHVENYSYQHPESITGAIEGYERANNISKLREYSLPPLLDNYVNKRSEKIDSNDKTVEYFHGGFFLSQKSWAQKDAAYSAMIDALDDGRYVDLSPHLPTLRNGHLGNQIRALVKSGRADHLVDGSPRTVSTFIHALQTKVDKHKQNIPPESELCFLLSTYLDDGRKNITDSQGKTKEFFYGSSFAFFQKSYTQKSEAVKDLQRALNGEEVNLNPHLSTLRNGQLGKELRAFIKSGKADQLFDNQPVRTVTEFVEALQQKVKSNSPSF